jgi:hypothetical protein
MTLRAIKIAPDNIEIVFMGSLLSPEPNRVESRGLTQSGLMSVPMRITMVRAHAFAIRFGGWIDAAIDAGA